MQLSARAVTRKGNFKQRKGNKNMFLVLLNATVGAACSVCQLCCRVFVSYRLADYSQHVAWQETGKFTASTFI